MVAREPNWIDILNLALLLSIFLLLVILLIFTLSTFYRSKVLRKLIDHTSAQPTEAGGDFRIGTN